MVSKLLVGTAVITSLVALSACDDRDTSVSQNGGDRVAVEPAQPNASQTATTQTATTKDDARAPNNGKVELTGEIREYAEKAAMGDMLEVESSRLALSRPAATDVKQFAQHMIDEHATSSDELKARLVRAGLIVELPTMLDNEHKQKLDDLRAANARDFDTRYVELQREGHEEALMLHRNYAMNGALADLKAFAADIVPKIEVHIQMANDLENKMRTRLSKQ